MNTLQEKQPPLFSASLMCMNMLEMKEQFRVLNERVQMYHVDIMDGHFCKNITLSPDFVKVCASAAKRPIDVHLMVEHPGDFLDQLIRSGAHCISPHAETINVDAFRTIDKIKSAGCRMGVVLNPSTPLSYVAHYLNHIDLLTIMTVDVGYSGGKFIPEMLEKIREAVRIREERGCITSSRWTAPAMRKISGRWTRPGRKSMWSATPVCSPWTPTWSARRTSCMGISPVRPGAPCNGQPC